MFFWPSARFEKYGGFVGCTFVIGARFPSRERIPSWIPETKSNARIGCGLSTLEVAANSYIAVLGSPQYAAARLNFRQGFQGVASFAGPLIASRWFFQGANATSLHTVQWCATLPVIIFQVVAND